MSLSVERFGEQDRYQCKKAGVEPHELQRFAHWTLENREVVKVYAPHFDRFLDENFPEWGHE